MSDVATTFVTTVALVGGVILIAALLSGLIERSRLPQVAVFLALGASVGAAGLGLIHLPLDAPLLHVVATLALVLVLFTDAVGLDIAETRRHAGLAALVLGPGTLLSSALIALAAWWVLGLGGPAAIILGAALASTDPVLLRGVFKHPSLPESVRQALRLESGLNDVVLLPVILVAMAFAGTGTGSAAVPWSSMALRTLLLGPAAGVAVGLAGIGALELVRRRVGVRRDYESIYSLGIAFLAFAAGEGLHGSGLLAGFAAGLTIALLDVDLCDCFLEYGQTTAEMALLFTFVLLGSGPIWSGFDVLDGRSIAFALLVLLARPAAFMPSLALSHLDARSRWLIAWFGPRGLSSLLLALLPVFAGMPGSERIFPTCCLVVLLSIAVHGGSVMLLSRGSGGTPEDRGRRADGPPLTMEVEELRTSDATTVLLDVRTEKSRRGSGLAVEGALRMAPDADVARRAATLGLPKGATLAAFCA